MDPKTIQRGDLLVSQYQYGPTNWIVQEVLSDRIICDIYDQYRNGDIYIVAGHTTTFMKAAQPIRYFPSWDVFKKVGSAPAWAGKKGLVKL